MVAVGKRSCATREKSPPPMSSSARCGPAERHIRQCRLQFCVNSTNTTGGRLASWSAALGILPEIENQICGAPGVVSHLLTP